MQCCKDLVNDLSILSREFTKEFELRKMVGDGAKADEKKDDKRGPGNDRANLRKAQQFG